MGCIEALGDPESAARVRTERNNHYRLQRVLQVLLQNGGEPLSAHDIDTTQPLDYDFRWVAGLGQQKCKQVLARLVCLVNGPVSCESQTAVQQHAC